MVVASNFIHLLCFCITHCELIHLCTIMCTQITLTTLIINHPNILFVCVCVCLCGCLFRVAVLTPCYMLFISRLCHVLNTFPSLTIFSHTLSSFFHLSYSIPPISSFTAYENFIISSRCASPYPAPIIQLLSSSSFSLSFGAVVAEAQHARQKKAKAIKDLCIKMKNFLRQKHYTVCCVQHTTFIFKYII